MITPPSGLSLLRHLTAITAGILVARFTTSGVSYDSWEALVVVVLVLSLLNLFVKPVLILLALPFVLLTLGLGILVINAGLLLGAGYLVEGFQVATFWHALWAALLIGIFSSLLAAVMHGKAHFNLTVHTRGGVRSFGNARPRPGNPPVKRIRRPDDDVIDV